MTTNERVYFESVLMPMAASDYKESGGLYDFDLRWEGHLAACEKCKK